jgi:hypothetical protein
MSSGAAHLGRIRKAHRGRLGPARCGNHVTKG